MIKLRTFSIQAPPRCGAGWLLKAIKIAGVEIKQPHRQVWEPETISTDRHTISIIRHPYEWLRSFYFANRGELYPKSLERLVRCACNSTSLFEFINTGIEKKLVTWTFRQYDANSVIRLEDFPAAPIMLFDMFWYPAFSCDSAEKIEALPRTDPTDFQILNSKVEKELREKLMEVEKSIYEKFDYLP